MLNDAVCFKNVYIVTGYTDFRNLSQQQFRWLMEGLTVTPKRIVKQVEPPEYMG